MKPTHHTNYVHFPKKLRRMRKYVSKSKRTVNILCNYRSTYLFTDCIIRFYKELSDAIQGGFCVWNSRMEINK